MRRPKKRKFRVSALPGVDTRGEGLARPYRDGVVVVHGVGYRDSWVTLRQVASSLESALRVEGLDAAFVEDAQTPVPSGELRIEGGRSLLLVEGHWADIVRDRREGWVRGGLARLRFVLAVFPYLLIAVLSPRGAEEAAAARGSSVSGVARRAEPARGGWARVRRLLAPELGVGFEEARRFAPTAWRMLTFAGVITATIWLFTLPWFVGVAVTAVVLVAAIVAIAMPGSVVEHVRFAAAGGDELADILARVGAAISYAEQNCERVWVIAHSQGGYLAHRVLQGGAHPRVRRFTGVASGLRPITIARAAASGRMIAAGWIHVLGMGILTFGMIVAVQPGGMLAVIPVGPTAAGASVGLAFPALFVSRPDVFFALVARGVEFGWAGWPFVVGGLVTALVGIVVRGNQGADLWRVGDLPARIAWEEISSGSDLVGSMSVPVLPPRARVATIPRLRHVLFDHGLGSYLSPAGALRLILAADASELALGRKNVTASIARADRVRARLAALSDQLYRFRGAVVGLALGFIVGVPLLYGRSLFDQAFWALPFCLGAGLFGWFIAWGRWRRLAPLSVRMSGDRVAGAPVTRREQRQRKAVAGAVLPQPRRSVVVMQGGLALAAVFISMGVAIVAQMFRQMAGVANPDLRLLQASGNLMFTAIWLGLGLVWLIARMRGAKAFTALALCTAMVALGHAVTVGDRADRSVVLLPGVAATTILIVLLVVQLCRRSSVPAPSSTIRL